MHVCNLIQSFRKEALALSMYENIKEEKLVAVVVTGDLNGRSPFFWENVIKKIFSFFLGNVFTRNLEYKSFWLLLSFDQINSCTTFLIPVKFTMLVNLVYALNFKDNN